MEETLKPYPEYQNSGQEWLGQVPAHWSVLPNRALFREVKDQNHPEESMLSVTISRGIIPQEVLLADSSKKDSSNLDKSKYKLVEPGDIAYNKMRAWQGALGVSEHRGIVSPAYIIVRPRQEVDPRYFHYLLRTPAFVKEAERWSYGITSDMWSLRYEDFKQIYCVLPPLDEQRKMARYLDQQFRRVGRLIRAKQRLIALLNEQKQAIIQRAVTRGLDPDVPLKPSGVDWLGDVPVHWEATPLKYLLRSRLAYGVLKPDRYTGGDAVPIVRIKDVTRGKVDLTNLEQISPTLSGEFSRTIVNVGDLVLSVVGTIGASFIVNRNLEGANLSRALARVQLNDKVRADYVRLIVESPIFKQFVDLTCEGTAQRVLNLGDLAQLPIPLPPREEQKRIVDSLEDDLRGVEEALGVAEREIDLIREYRTRLIADVVTGKLDVRGVEVPEMAADGSNALDENETSHETATLAEETA